jgi:hypothetical protein
MAGGATSCGIRMQLAHRLTVMLKTKMVLTAAGGHGLPRQQLQQLDRLRQGQQRLLPARLLQAVAGVLLARPLQAVVLLLVLLVMLTGPSAAGKQQRRRSQPQPHLQDSNSSSSKRYSQCQQQQVLVRLLPSPVCLAGCSARRLHQMMTHQMTCHTCRRWLLLMTAKGQQCQGVCLQLQFRLSRVLQQQVGVCSLAAAAAAAAA